MQLFRSTDELERRQASRRSPNPAVSGTIRDPRTRHSWPTGICDISLMGVTLLADQRFENGQLLTLELWHDQRGWAREYLIEVRHADICCPNDAWLHGCRFARPLREEELCFWL